MALGDYILCCKCEIKLIYDGDRSQREWWEERFGKPPEIECPDCKTESRKPLTDGEILDCWKQAYEPGRREHDNATRMARAIEAKLKEKNA